MVVVLQFWESELHGKVTKVAANKMSQGGKQWAHNSALNTLSSHASAMVRFEALNCKLCTECLRFHVSSLNQTPKNN